MRQLINNYTFTAGTRDITIQSAYQIGVHNVRLIVNETQKVVICSSMQKDNISIANNVITYSSSLPALASGDSITIEIDLGEDLNASMNDIILRAKIEGATGTPFSVTMGSYLDMQIQAYYHTPHTYVAPLSTFFRETAIEEFSSDYEASGKVGYLMEAFKNCSMLKRVSLPNYKVTYSDVGYSLYTDAFTGCTKLTYAKLNPIVMQYGSKGVNPLYTMLYLTDLYLSTDAANHLRLDMQPNLTFASVKNILEHCANANMSGKTITFYSNGLTIQDDADGTIQTLYNSVVNTYGATIANLTITPYSA